jgi:acyl-CoA synthetase (AMP-forming)/AMP-acid ligase II/acyl carrier protein
MSFSIAHLSIVDQLKWRAANQPDKLALCYLADGETETERLTYQALDLAAKKIAAKLQSLHLKNEYALMLYSSGVEFVKAFFGCLYAGVIAVPTYIPKSKQILHKIESIAQDCDASIILTTQDFLEEGYLSTSRLAKLITLATEAIEDEASDYQSTETAFQNMAFIQYTSGSTSQPKGVIVNYKNIQINQSMLQYVFELSEASVGVTWLPLFHDMGLIASLLNAVFVGYPIYIMPPSAFIRDPARWLQCISKYHGTYTCAPNFAYDLCVKKISPEVRAQLDLSSLKKAINAAEPIQYIILKEFMQTFAASGFNEAAFTPAYGLAEATVFVCGKKEGAVKYAYLDAQALQKNKVVPSLNPQTSQILVSCGTANFKEQKIAIVNPDTLQECIQEIGEIWISGDHIAQGYLHKPEMSQEVFHAKLNGRDYLRTGDIGFIDAAGELFITGRIKDLIILKGSNYYPQDIELTVEALDNSIRKNSVAAFSAEVDHQEELIVVVEVNRNMLADFSPDVFGSKIKSAVFNYNQLAIHEIVFIAPGTLPKTTSGKIQRQACKIQYQARQLNILSQFPSVKTDDVAVKAEIITCIILFLAKNKKLPLESVTADSLISDFGIDSIQMAALSVELEKIIQITVPEKIFYEYPTIQAMADFLIDLPAQKMREKAAEALKISQQPISQPHRKIAMPKFSIRPSQPSKEPTKG